MSHLENAGYRILSFKYRPVVVKKDEPVLEGGNNEASNTSPTKSPDGELPSLSTLMTSLREIEDDAGADQNRQHQQPAEMVSEPEDNSALRPLPTPTAKPTAPAPLTEFHLFGDLPTELRLKIWNLTFLPRVVELRSTRPNYSAGHDDGRQPQVSCL